MKYRLMHSHKCISAEVLNEIYVDIVQRQILAEETDDAGKNLKNQRTDGRDDTQEVSGSSNAESSKDETEPSDSAAEQEEPNQENS